MLELSPFQHDSLVCLLNLTLLVNDFPLIVIAKAVHEVLVRGATLFDCLSIKGNQAFGGFHHNYKIVGLCKFAIVPIWTNFICFG